MHEDTCPLISVIIPTHHRANLLIERALPSVLSQWYQHLEVIVVIDGGDPATEMALTEVARHDHRVRFLSLEHSVGGGGARNAGIKAARGEWVAFLDDDDMWLPDKLQRQLATARASHFSSPIVSCAWIARTDHGDAINIPHAPVQGQTMGEYLLLRPNLRERGYSLTTSTLFAPRALLERVPFSPNLPKHQDTDLLLRLAEVPGVGLEISPEVQVIYFIESGRSQISWQQDWRRSLQWAEAHRTAGRLNRRTVASFLVSYLTPPAARPFQANNFFGMLFALIRLMPRPFEWALFLAFWIFPAQTRQRIRVERIRPKPPPGEYTSVPPPQVLAPSTNTSEHGH